MLVILRRFLDRDGKQEITHIQVDIAPDQTEVYIQVSKAFGLNLIDAPNVYGTARFKDNGIVADNGKKIFDFDGYSD